MKLKCANWVEIKEIIYENMNLKAWSKNKNQSWIQRLGVALVLEFKAKDKSKRKQNE